MSHVSNKVRIGSAILSAIFVLTTSATAVLAEDTNQQATAQPAEKHHSKAKGAFVGGAGGAVVGGKKGAAVGAAGGALVQHHKNKKAAKKAEKAQ
jgi:hypothetical protein